MFDYSQSSEYNGPNQFSEEEFKDFRDKIHPESWIGTKVDVVVGGRRARVQFISAFLLVGTAGSIAAVEQDVYG